MNPENLLHVRRLPSRLNAEGVAVLVGCAVHDIPVVVRTGLLKPLGSPASNSVKYFASSETEAKISDVKWCARATNCLYNYWRDRRQPKPE